MVAQVYDGFTNHSVSTSGFPSQSTVVGKIMSMWDTISVSSGFTNLMDQWGADNFTFWVHAQEGVGIQEAFYAVIWQKPGVLNFSGGSNTTNYTYEEYWTGNLSTGVVTGPTLQIHQDGANAGGVTNSNNWSGWEFSIPNWYIYYTSSDTQVKQFTNPGTGQCCVPWWIHIDPVGSAWTGLSAGSGGTGGLWQTGYEWDTTGWSPSNSQYYPLFVEFYPYINTFNYPGNPSVKISDWLSLGLGYDGWQCNDCYYADVYDYTSGNYWWTWQNLAYTSCWLWWCSTENLWPNGDAQTIVEAFEYGSQIQQIAKYDPVYFEDTWLCNLYGSCWSAETAVVSWGTYTIYNLAQTSWPSCSSANTAQNWIYGYGYSGVYGYSKESWSNSNYNWWCTQ